MPTHELTPDEILELVDAGRIDEARAAYEQALSRRSDDLDLLTDAADCFINVFGAPDGDNAAVERGIELARRAQKLAVKVGEAELAEDLRLLEAVGLNELGDPGGALSAVDAVLAEDPERADALTERGSALYELCRFDEAKETLARALQVEPDRAWAHHLAGLVAERLGNSPEAERHFAKARSLAPEDFPQPVRLTPEAFDDVVEAALAELPESVRRWLLNVAITVEDLPQVDDLTASDPPLSPSSLGMFRGSPLGDKAAMDPWSHFPSSIVLYQKNLERSARDADELVDEICVTLLHEVGHFLGLDEHDLWERGLD